MALCCGWLQASQAYGLETKLDLRVLLPKDLILIQVVVAQMACFLAPVVFRPAGLQL